MNINRLVMFWSIVLLPATIAACASCTPSPAPPVVDAAPPATSVDVVAQCGSMCISLRLHGCLEGQADAGDACERTCIQVEGQHTANLHPLCVADAGSVEAIRACGTVRCAK